MLLLKSVPFQPVPQPVCFANCCAVMVEEGYTFFGLTLLEWGLKDSLVQGGGGLHGLLGKRSQFKAK